jgi:glutamate formiminotransferase
VVDVVPFVPLAGSTMADALGARDDFAAWAAAELGVPCFLYGPERSLPEIRRQAWNGLQPDVGPDRPHPTAGAICVGARTELVAFNVYLRAHDLGRAKRVAALIRGPHLRALGLPVGDAVQVSMNLISPAIIGPAQAYDAVARHAAIERSELVGLVPAHVLHTIPAWRWPELDLAEDRTIEQRVARAAGYADAVWRTDSAR